MGNGEWTNNDSPFSIFHFRLKDFQKKSLRGKK